MSLRWTLCCPLELCHMCKLDSVKLQKEMCLEPCKRKNSNSAKKLTRSFLPIPWKRFIAITKCPMTLKLGLSPAACCASGCVGLSSCCFEAAVTNFLLEPASRSMSYSWRRFSLPCRDASASQHGRTACIQQAQPERNIWCGLFKANMT